MFVNRFACVSLPLIENDDDDDDKNNAVFVMMSDERLLCAAIGIVWMSVTYLLHSAAASLPALGLFHCFSRATSILPSLLSKFVAVLLV